MKRRLRPLRRAALAAVALLGAAAPPAEAFPGLSMVYTTKEPAASVYDGRPGIAGLTESIRQFPVLGDPRWATTWLAGKVRGRELATMSAPQMAATLRRAWQNARVGDLVGVDELVARDWTPAASARLRAALASLGPDAGRVVFYVGPALVSQVGRADPRRPLEPRLERVLAALRLAGAVQLEMYQGGGIPWSRAQFAAYATRWLARFAPGDPGKLHLLFGPARAGVTAEELWHRARSTPAGRAILANGAGVWGLRSAEEGLAWLQGYREYRDDPNAPPPGGDVAVPTGGGLGLAAAGERRITVRLSRPARAVVTLRRVGTRRARAIAKVRGPMRPRRIVLPADVRPGRYRVRAVAQGDGLKDAVDIPFRVRRPRVQQVPDPRVQGADGAPAAERVVRPSRRADLLRSLITLDGRYRLLLGQVADCRARSVDAEQSLRLRAVDEAVLDDADGLDRRLALLSSGARSLDRAIAACREAPPALSPPEAPSGPAAPSAPAPPARRELTLVDLLAGRAIDVSATLGARVLPSIIAPVDLAALEGPACRAPGAVCLGLDRPALDGVLRGLLEQRQSNPLQDLLDGLFGRRSAPALPPGDLSLSVAVERVGDRSLRLVPTGPIAVLAGLTGAPATVVGRLQAVGDVPVGAAAAWRPRPSAFRAGAAPAERRLLAALNRERATRRLPALRISVALARPARRHAALLARSGLLAHESGGSPFWTRLVAGGYPPRRAMAENLARVDGCDASGAERTVRLWLASPAHRANMLSRAYRAVGVGASADAGCTRTVYTADFGG